MNMEPGFNADEVNFSIAVIPTAPPMSPSFSSPRVKQQSEPANVAQFTTPARLAPPPMTPNRVPSSPSFSFASPSSSFVSFLSPSRSQPPAAFALDGTVVEGTVATIASNYMLMEYAAQIKGLTQHRVVSGIRRLRHVPREVCDAARMVKSEALRLLAIIKTEIDEIASGRKAQKAKLEQIKSSHSFLQAATELLDQAEVETVQRAKKRRQSSTMPQQQPATIVEEVEPPARPQQSAVSSLASLMAGLNDPAASPISSPIPSATLSPSPSAEASTAADAAKISELAALVAALSQQMAALKGAVPPASSNPLPVQAPGGAVASVGPSVPVAPSMSPRNSVTPQLKPVNVPQAPPLTKDSFWFTGVHRDVVAASAEQEDQENVAPKITAPSAPASSRAAVLGEITNRPAGGLRKVGASTSGGPQKERSQSMIDPIPSKPVVQCYTRRIPGSESMSLTDSIKVASRIKLRRTEQERSPGGTPCKTSKSYSAGNTQDVLQAALAARFKNVHAMDAAAKRSQSVILTKEHVPKRQPSMNDIQQRRNSIDKENWETS